MFAYVHGRVYIRKQTHCACTSSLHVPILLVYILTSCPDKNIVKICRVMHVVLIFAVLFRIVVVL